MEDEMGFQIIHTYRQHRGAQGPELRSGIRERDGAPLQLPTDPVIPEMSRRYIKSGKLLSCTTHENVIVCAFSVETEVDEIECFTNCLSNAVMVAR